MSTNSKSPHFLLQLLAALLLILIVRWLPVAYSWFVLEAPAWLVGLCILLVIYLARSIERG